MADNPGMVSAYASYLRWLDDMAQRPEDHPDVLALIRDHVEFVREMWPAMLATPTKPSKNDVRLKWLMLDLASERLTPTQVSVLRDTIELRRAVDSRQGAGVKPSIVDLFH